MKVVNEEFVLESYLSKCIDIPIENILYNLPFYTYINCLVEFEKEDEYDCTEIGTVRVDGFVAVKNIQFFNEPVRDQTGLTKYTKVPYLFEIEFTHYSINPELAGKSICVNTVLEQQVDLKNKLYSIEEVWDRCDFKDVAFNRPQHNLDNANDNSITEVTDTDAYPALLQLTIDAYKKWWKNPPDKDWTNSVVDKWLIEESEKRGVTSLHKGIVNNYLSGAAIKGIHAIIKPDSVKNKNKAK